jgi:hypothetical protein
VFVETDQYTGNYTDTHTYNEVLTSVDYVAKTITQYTYTLTVPFAVDNGVFSYPTPGEENVHLDGTTCTVLVNNQNYTWPSGPYAGQTGAWYTWSFDYTTGGAVTSSSTPVGIEAFDEPVSAGGELNDYINMYVHHTGNQFFMLHYSKGAWLVDFGTGTVVYTTGYSDFQQSYSSDYIDYNTSTVAVVEYYVLSGSVYDGGDPVERTLYVYDQSTGQFITTVTSDVNGDFSVVLFTNTEKFVVCPSSVNTENYKITAYVAPA